MDIMDQLSQLIEQNKKLKKEKRELVKELNFLRNIEKEAVRRYEKASEELLLYYIHYGKLDIKEAKKKK